MRPDMHATACMSGLKYEDGLYSFGGMCVNEKLTVTLNQKIPRCTPHYKESIQTL